MRIASKIKSNVDRRIKKLMRTFREKQHYFSLKNLASTADYSHYLTQQLKRTFLKNKNSLLPRTKTLINLIFDQGNPSLSSKVLCIGCRNTAELNYFQSKGLQDVIGIDLFSEDPRIRVMDMHNLTFLDNSFNIVYSSHSLEHSYDIRQVVHEVVRVACDQAIIAIEVPVRYATTEADRYDLQNIEGVMGLFSDYQTQMIYNHDWEARTPQNDEGTPIVRVIFKIKK